MPTLNFHSVRLQGIKIGCTLYIYIYIYMCVCVCVCVCAIRNTHAHFVIGLNKNTIVFQLRKQCFKMNDFWKYHEIQICEWVYV